MKDKYSNERLSLFHPKAIDGFRSFIEESESTFGIVLRIMLGLRTFSEQNELYSHGRNGDTRPKLTDAKGGQSFHNYGLAGDFCVVNQDGSINWNFDMSKLVPIAEKYGISWGGNWIHIKDKPHFEMKFNFKENCSDLLELVNSGKVDENGYVLID